MTAVRYPKRFERYRLEALGDDPYFSIEEAAARFDEGQLLTVVPDASPIAWQLSIAGRTYPFGGTHRFTLTFYSPTKTPLREVQWETIGDRVVCRSMLDAFYPDGDPERRVPYAHVITVSQEFSTDGILQVVVSSPIEDETVTERAGVDGATSAVPAFGAWEAIIAASTPPSVERFGLTALDSSRAFANEADAAGEPDAARGVWRVPFDDRGAVAAVDAAREERPAPAGAVVLERGLASVIPLAAQLGAPEDHGRAADEERRRCSRFADRVRGALEHRYGAQIAFDLAHRGTDSVASYAASLRAAGATAASWWVGDATGIALVWSGSAEVGDLALALHVVPPSWVSDRRASEAAPQTDLRWSATEWDA